MHNSQMFSTNNRKSPADTVSAVTGEMIITFQQADEIMETQNLYLRAQDPSLRTCPGAITATAPVLAWAAHTPQPLPLRQTPTRLVAFFFFFPPDKFFSSTETFAPGTS